MDEHGKEFLGRGWAFPFTIVADTGMVRTAAYEEDIRQAIHIILATAKGERVMRPDFGCGIHDLVFAAVTTSLVAQIRRDVTEALRKYEARIEVLEVTVGQTRLLDGYLEVSIDYRVQTTNQRDNYVFPFYFRQAA